MPCRTGSEMFAAGYVLLRCLSRLSALWKGCKSPAPTWETKHGDLDFGYVSSSRTVLSAAVSKRDPPRHAVFPCLYEEPTISNSRHCLSSLHAQLFPFLPNNRCRNINRVIATYHSYHQSTECDKSIGFTPVKFNASHLFVFSHN